MSLLKFCFILFYIYPATVKRSTVYQNRKQVKRVPYIEPQTVRPESFPTFKQQPIYTETRKMADTSTERVPSPRRCHSDVLQISSYENVVHDVDIAPLDLHFLRGQFDQQPTEFPYLPQSPNFPAPNTTPEANIDTLQATIRSPLTPEQEADLSQSDDPEL